jgi:hypothetical protein
MNEVLFGIKIGLGVAIGLWLAWRVCGWVTDLVLTLRFTRAGFTWERSGWLSRDPDNDDWILWDPKNHRMLRSSDSDTQWRLSAESLGQCLSLGHKYEKTWKDRLAGERHGG